MSVEIKHVVEGVGRVAAESGFRANAVRWAFAADEHGGKQRTEFPFSGNVGLLFVFDQNSGAVSYAKAESRGVVDLSNTEGASAGKSDVRVRHAVGIALDIRSQHPSRIQV